MARYYDPAAVPAATEAADSYVGQINPSNLRTDPRFLADLRAEAQARGIEADSDEQLVRWFYSDQNWRNLNTVGMATSTAEAYRVDADRRARIGRLQQVYDQLPDFWQQGGRGAAALGDIATSVVVDPTNLLPGARALEAGVQAARAGGSALRAAMRTGALVEGGINAGVEAASDAALQMRDRQLGLRDEYSPMQTGVATAAGGVLGGTVGALIGAAVSPAARREAAQQLTALIRAGVPEAEARAMPYDEAVAFLNNPPGTPRPTMRDQEFGPTAEALGPEYGPTTRPGPGDDIDTHAIEADISERRRAYQDAVRRGAPEDETRALEEELARSINLRGLQAAIRQEEAQINALRQTNDPARQAEADRLQVNLERRRARYELLRDDPEEPILPSDRGPSGEPGGPPAAGGEGSSGGRDAPDAGAAPAGPTTPPRPGGGGAEATPEGPVATPAATGAATPSPQAADPAVQENIDAARKAAGVAPEQAAPNPNAPLAVGDPLRTVSKKGEALDWRLAEVTQTPKGPVYIAEMTRKDGTTSRTRLNETQAMAARVSAQAAAPAASAAPTASAPGAAATPPTPAAAAPTSSPPAAVATPPTGAAPTIAQPVTPPGGQTAAQTGAPAPAAATPASPPAPKVSAKTEAVAKELKVDLAEVQGTGKNGAISVRDVRQHAQNKIEFEANAKAMDGLADTLDTVAAEFGPKFLTNRKFVEAMVRNDPKTADMADRIMRIYDDNMAAVNGRVGPSPDQAAFEGGAKARDEAIRSLAYKLKELFPDLNRRARIEMATSMFDKEPAKYAKPPKARKEERNLRRVADRTAVAGEALGSGPVTAGRTTHGRIQEMLRSAATFERGTPREYSISWGDLPNPGHFGFEEAKLIADLAQRDRAGAVKARAEAILRDALRRGANVDVKGAMASARAELEKLTGMVRFTSTGTTRVADGKPLARGEIGFYDPITKRAWREIDNAYVARGEAPPAPTTQAPIAVSEPTRAAAEAQMERLVNDFIAGKITKQQLADAVAALNAATRQETTTPAATNRVLGELSLAEWSTLASRSADQTRYYFMPARPTDPAVVAVNMPSGKRYYSVVEQRAGKTVKDPITDQARLDAILKPLREKPEAGKTAAPADQAAPNKADQAAPAPAADLPRLPATSEDGRMLAIRSKENPRLVRVVTQKQIDAGIENPLQALLGRAAIDRWDVGYVDAGARSMTPRAAETFIRHGGDETASLRPMAQAEFDVKVIQVADLTPDETAALDRATRLIVGRSISALPEGQITPGTGAFTNRELDGAALRRIVHNFDIAKFPFNRERLQERISDLVTLNGLMERLAPNGITLPVEARIKAVDNIRDIMSRFGPDVADEAARLVRSLGGDPTTAPIFRNRDATGIERGRSGHSYASETNVVNVGRGEGPMPPLNVLMHEIGHWAYNNILTAKDRIDFWRSMDRFYAENGTLDTGAVRNKSYVSGASEFGFNDAAGNPARAKIEYVYGSPQEHFANQFMMWAAQQRMKPEFLDESLWRRLINYVKEIFDAFRNPKTLDDNLLPLFNKIIPADEAPVIKEPNTPVGSAIKTRLDQLNTVHRDLERALASDDPKQIVDAAVNVAGWIRGVTFTGKSADGRAIETFSPLRTLAKYLKDKRRNIWHALNDTADASEGAADAAVRAGFDAETFSVSRPLDEAAQRIAALFDDGIAVGTKKLEDGTEVPNYRPYSSLTDALTIARDRLIRAYQGAEGGALPPGTPEGWASSARPFRSKAHDAKSRAILHAKRKSLQAKKGAEETVATPARERLRDPKRLAEFLRHGRDVPANVRAMSMKTLEREFLANQGTPLGDAIAAEMMVRARVSKLPKPVDIPVEVRGMKRQELEGGLLEAVRGGDKKRIEQIRAEMHRRAMNRYSVTADTKLTSAIKAADEQSILMPTEDAIPGAARPVVQEMLGALTHRDPMTQSALRTLAYRLFALNGRAEPSPTDFITSGEIARLAGTTSTLGDSTPMTDLASQEFKAFRSQLRRLATDLVSYSDRSKPVSDLFGVLSRSDFLNDEDRWLVRAAYAAEVRREEIPFEREIGPDGSARFPSTRLTNDEAKWLADRAETFATGGSSAGTTTAPKWAGRVFELLDKVEGKLVDGAAFVLRGVGDEEHLTPYPGLWGGVSNRTNPLSYDAPLASHPGIAETVVAAIRAELPRAQRAKLSAFIGEPSIAGTDGILYSVTREIGEEETALLATQSGPLGQGYYLGIGSRSAFLDGRSDVLADHITALPEDRQREAVQIMTDRAQTAQDLTNAYWDWHRYSQSLDRWEDAKNAEQTIGVMLENLDTLDQALRSFGIEPPNVHPIATSFRNVLDLGGRASYSPDHPVVDTLLRRLADNPDITDPAFNHVMDVMRNLGRDNVDPTGEWLLSTITDAFRMSGDREPDVAVRHFLKDMGYDAVRFGPDGYQIAVLDDARVRELAAFLDAADDEPFDIVGGAPATGEIARILAADEQADIRASAFGPIGEHLRASGASPGVINAMMRAWKGRELSGADGEAIRRAADLQLRSNSSRMRKVGMNWLADWYQNFFPHHHQTMAGKFMPIHEMLQKLPDAPGGLVAWWRKSTLNDKQPESYDRIVRALRRGEGSRAFGALKPEERQVFSAIRQMFQTELQNMRSAGVLVGDLGPNYFPQPWRMEAVHKDREGALAFFRKYYETEAMVEGRALKPGDADAFARGVFASIAEEDGVHIPQRGMARNATGDHIDFQRMIRLDKFPELLPEAEKFLENDLTSILVKYLDASTRRILQTQKLGVHSHGFYDYMAVLDGGLDAVGELLSKNRVTRKDVRVLNGDRVDVLTFTDETFMPFEGDFHSARAAADEAFRILGEGGAPAAREYLMGLSKLPAGPGRDTYAKRVDAIIGALQDYKGKENPVAAKEISFAEAAMRVAMRKPVQPTSSIGFGDTAIAMSRGVRNFNAVTLLGFTTLTSIPDTIMPLIRSGSMQSYMKGIAKYARDPEWRTALRNIGVSIEGIVADRMTYAFGQIDGRLTNAFFNATMLTPWTVMMREVAASVGFESFKAMQAKAVKNRVGDGLDMSKQNRDYKLALRFLNRYGLGEFATNNRTLDDIDLLRSDDKVRDAIMRFTNDAIFQPNADDIPIWAQTPLGSVIFQLKSYPLMMSRMAKDVLMDAWEANDYKRLGMLLSLGPAFGMGALAVKDVVQARGGEDNREAALRNRNILKSMGYDEKVHGNENDFLGWYFEGLMTMGGLGIIADMTQSIVSQLDNGAYGFQRVLSTVFGPSVGTAAAAFNVAAGAQDAIMGSTPSNAKERTAVRELMARIPVLGGIGAAREGVVDEIAGEATGRRGGGGSSGFGGRLTGSFGGNFGGNF